VGIRIALFTEKFAPDRGGIACGSERIASLLAKNGHDVTVILPSGRLHPGDREETQQGGYRLISFGMSAASGETLSDWHDVAVAAQKKHHIDLFHALHASYAAWAAVYGARWIGIPSVVTTRGADLDTAIGDPKRLAPVTWAFQMADAVTASTPELGRKVHTLVGERAVYLAPPSANPEIFRRVTDGPDVRRKLGFDGARVIGFSGEAKKRKGLVTLLKAFHRLAQEDASYRLLMVGSVKREDAHLVAGFRKAHPELAKSVRLLPWKGPADLARLYNCMDVLAIPAVRTAGTTAVIEGMACELPVVVTDVCGLHETVKHETTGMVVPPRDDAALAEALRRLFREGEFRQKLGVTARAWALGEATPEKEEAALNHAYRRALGQGKTGDTVRFEPIPGQRKR